MIEPLIWDSNFFHLKIGRILPGSFDKVIFQEEKKHYDLIYIFEDSYNLNAINKISELSIPPIDIKLTYTKKIINAIDIPEIYNYTLPSVNEQLLKLSFAAGQYSRFNLDKNFNTTQYEALYQQWITASVQKENADFILVSNNQAHPTGFITLIDKQTYIQIGLLAVDSNFRGSGIGQKLIQKAIFTAFCSNFKTIKVTTQKQNSSACRLYEQCGFAVESSIHVYHYWNR